MEVVEMDEQLQPAEVVPLMMQPEESHPQRQQQAIVAMEMADNPSEPPTILPTVPTDSSTRGDRRAYSRIVSGNLAVQQQQQLVEVHQIEDPSSREPVAHRHFFQDFIDDFDESDLS